MNMLVRTICAATLFLVGSNSFGESPAQNVRTSEFRATQLLRHKAAHDAFENEYMSPIREAAKNTPEVCGIRLYVERENHNAQQTYLALGMHETVYRLYEEEF